MNNQPGDLKKMIHIDKRGMFRLDAHYRLLISVLVGAIGFFCFEGHVTTPALALATWICCASTVILLDWIIIFTSHPREVRKIARLQDSSRTFLFIFIIVASVVSLVAILFLLKSSKGTSEMGKNEHIILSITAVAVSWWLVHTVFTFRYAHLYYDTEADDGTKLPGGGLDFPDTKDPDYLDFVYFSFVVGMTFQVSDVQITNRTIRRACLMHALIAFAFNTAIVALSINVISGLVSQ